MLLNDQRIAISIYQQTFNRTL